MDRGGKRLEAVCALLTHQLGFELRLNINGELRRSQLCRSTDEVLSLTDRWKTSLLAGPAQARATCVSSASDSIVTGTRSDSCSITSRRSITSGVVNQSTERISPRLRQEEC